MATVVRAAAQLGNIVRLKVHFSHNGTLADPYSLGDVEVRDAQDTLVATLTPVKEDTGIYYIDCDLTSATGTGWYTDLWTDITYEVGWDTQQVENSFYVQPLSWTAVDPHTCRVYDYIYTSEGEPFAGAVGYATITTLPYDYSNAVYGNPTEDGLVAYADVNGLIHWDLVYGLTVAFEVEDAGIGKICVIPDQVEVRLTDLEEVS